MYKFLVALALVSAFLVQGIAQNNSGESFGTRITLHTKTGDLQGTLLVPNDEPISPLVLIIAGSGPTDRDGNNPMMKNNSLKMLAESLSKNSIASLRYDKRGVAESKDAGKDESDLRFEDYISDAAEWIRMLRKDDRFSKVIVLGHSEGSLIGMVAANQASADAYISVAGAGKRADILIKEQLQAQPEFVRNMAFPILDSLSQGFEVKKVDPMLNSLFRPSVQPYMISWFKYDPVKEIVKLNVPVLILQGTTDIQVSKEDAQLLADGNKGSELVVIDGMNHILKASSMERDKNIATYSNPNLPIKSEIQNVITDFIKKL